jgi:hypothetical protein
MSQFSNGWSAVAARTFELTPEFGIYYEEYNPDGLLKLRKQQSADVIFNQPDGSNGVQYQPNRLAKSLPSHATPCDLPLEFLEPGGRPRFLFSGMDAAAQ